MGYDVPRSLGERESGGGLALPIWIDYMSVALKGVPVAPVGEAPPGLLRAGDDWLYAEWAEGGRVAHIAADAGVRRVPVLPAVAAPGEPAAPSAEAQESSPGARAASSSSPL
jgi:penicillin-binding protein 1A